MQAAGLLASREVAGLLTHSRGAIAARGMRGLGNKHAYAMPLLVVLFLAASTLSSMATEMVSMSIVSLTQDIVQNPGNCDDEPITKDTAQEIFDSGTMSEYLQKDRENVNVSSLKRELEPAVNPDCGAY